MQKFNTLPSREILEIFKLQFSLMWKNPKRYFFFLLSNLVAIAPIVFVGLTVLKNNYLTIALLGFTSIILNFGYYEVLKTIQAENRTLPFTDYFVGFKKINSAVFLLALVQMLVVVFQTIINSQFKNSGVEAPFYLNEIGPVLFELFWGILFGWVFFTNYLLSRKQAVLSQAFHSSISAYFKNINYIVWASVLFVILSIPFLLVSVAYMLSIQFLMNQGMPVLMSVMWGFVIITYINNSLISVISLVLGTAVADKIFAAHP